MTKYQTYTLFTGTLEQKSALSVGGNQGLGGTVDSPFCRDGQGRATLRGESLAGCLIATARTLCKKEYLYKIITWGPTPDTKEKLTPSRWRIFNTHPNKESIENRQGVGIRQSTGAAAEGVLFDLETLPRGTQWWFCLEVRGTNSENGKKAEKVAAAALLEWERGRCWLGRSVARGLGWLELKNLKAYQLTNDHFDYWPNSEDKPQNIISTTLNDVPQISSIQFLETFQFDDILLDRNDRTQYIEFHGEIQVGEHEEGYGIDALSVGGHAANQLTAEWHNHYLPSEGLKDNHDVLSDRFKPESAFVSTRKNTLTPISQCEPKYEPFLPGSGIRGTIRHSLSRFYRLRDNYVFDPNDHSMEPSPDEVSDLFGSIKQSASLLIQDAYVTNEDWLLSWLQHHAEDEFSQSTFESSKYDSVVLLKGTFEWKMVLAVDARSPLTRNQNQSNREYAKKLCQRLVPLLILGEMGHLPLGGGQWRGVGWPKWKINSVILVAAGCTEGEMLPIPSSTLQKEGGVANGK